MTFEDAARRTAQLAYDLKFQGVPIFYSWPSKGELAGYPADEATIEVGQGRTSSSSSRNSLLVRMPHRSISLRTAWGIELSRARYRKYSDSEGAHTNPVPHFREVVLAAPDIDAGVFRELAVSIESAADRGGDALRIVERRRHSLHPKNFTITRERVRSGPNLIVVNGIDTVDVTAIDTSFPADTRMSPDNDVRHHRHLRFAGRDPRQRIESAFHQRIWRA